MKHRKAKEMDETKDLMKKVYAVLDSFFMPKDAYGKSRRADKRDYGYRIKLNRILSQDELIKIFKISNRITAKQYYTGQYVAFKTKPVTVIFVRDPERAV